MYTPAIFKPHPRHTHSLPSLLLDTLTLLQNTLLTHKINGFKKKSAFSTYLKEKRWVFCQQEHSKASYYISHMATSGAAESD